jgi:hypothetical protein
MYAVGRAYAVAVAVDVAVAGATIALAHGTNVRHSPIVFGLYKYIVSSSLKPFV